MIGVACQDSKGAVDLLCHNDPGQLMGQSHEPQREKEIGTLFGRSRPSIRRTDGEYHPLGSLITKPPDLTGKLLRAVLPTATVKQNRISTSSALLPSDPLKQRPLRFKRLRFARSISSNAADIVIEPPSPGLGERSRR